MDTESIMQKRDLLKPGTRVVVLSDDWTLHRKEGTMLDPEPVVGSSQCIVELDGEEVTLSIHDVFRPDYANILA
jgi:hypothetical protein